MPRYVDQPPDLLARLRRRPGGRYRYVRAPWRVACASIDFFGSWLCAALRTVRRAAMPGRKRPDTTNVQRILLVQLDHLGDAIITTAMLGPLRRAYPQAEIHVLASPRSAAVFCESPLVDRLHVWSGYRFDGARWWRWLPGVATWAVRLYSWRFCLGFDVRGEAPLAALLWLAGVRRRLGWASGGGGFLLSASANYVPGRAEIESRRALLLAAEIAGVEESTLAPHWPGEPSAERDVAARLADASISGRPFVVIHTGAGAASKRWPAENFRQLIASLSTHQTDGQRLTVVLVGGQSDRPRSAIIAPAGRVERVIDWTGQLNLPQLAALCARAALYIGADSGPAHLAAATGVPVLALFSGSNLARQWRPVGRRIVVLQHPTHCGPCHRLECPWSDHPCLGGISPGRVFDVAKGMLGQRGNEVGRADWPDNAEQSVESHLYDEAMPYRGTET